MYRDMRQIALRICCVTGRRGPRGRYQLKRAEAALRLLDLDNEADRGPPAGHRFTMALWLITGGPSATPSQEGSLKSSVPSILGSSSNCLVTRKRGCARS